MLRTAVAATLALLVLLPGDAPADDEEGERAGLRARIAEMEATIRELQAEIRRLRNRVQVLEGGEEQATSGKKDEPAIPGNEYDGWVVVPLLVRPKAAFERITREDLYNPKQRRFMTVKLKPSDVPAACVTNVRNLLGRVLRNDKRPVEFFLESELFPLGTRPGPAAGVPSGRVGLWIPEEAVSGIPHLVRYAEFDLLDPRRDPDGRARARAVVEGGLIVQPGGVDDRGVFIAVTSDEAKALATALADAIKLWARRRMGSEAGKSAASYRPGTRAKFMRLSPSCAKARGMSIRLTRLFSLGLMRGRGSTRWRNHALRCAGGPATS